MDREKEALDIVDVLAKHTGMSEGTKKLLLKKLVTCSEEYFQVIKHFASVIKNKKSKNSTLRDKRYARIKDNIKNKKVSSILLFPIEDPYKDTLQEDLNSMFKD